MNIPTPQPNYGNQTKALLMQEIERLRAENATLQQRCIDYARTKGEIHGMYDRVVEENSTLRAELKTWHDFGRAMAQSGLNGLTIPVAESEQE